jgi:divalent metal cation (Fe/Co/Zn/Cd) transporter
LKKSNAANLSLILVIVGWLLAISTVLLNFGDPDPRIPSAQMQRQVFFSGASLWVAIIFILISLLLAGYAFRDAKRRAALTLAVGLLPFLGLGVYALTEGF